MPLVLVTTADSRRGGATRPLHVMCARAQLSDAPKPRESLPCITDNFTINASDNDKKLLIFYSESIKTLVLYLKVGFRMLLKVI